MEYNCKAQEKSIDVIVFVFVVADLQDIVPHELRIRIVNHLRTVEDKRVSTRGNCATFLEFSRVCDPYFFFGRTGFRLLKQLIWRGEKDTTGSTVIYIEVPLKGDVIIC